MMKISKALVSICHISVLRLDTKIICIFSLLVYCDYQNLISVFLTQQIFSFSLLPYSEPDQDLSPNNDPDWDWGEGAQRDTQEAKEEADKKIEEKKNVLSEAILTDTNNVISELSR